ncbi:MAG: B12-binding domain-containing radical SAM protein [Planctomycetes bacterium]|nr:B12-binding domain-containing radical SAM protein [Planctomycetota bacterium]
MKFLLIHPNKYAERYASLGLGMLSAAVKAAGHEFMLLDTSRFASGLGPTAPPHDAGKASMEASLQFKPVELPTIPRAKISAWEGLEQAAREFSPDLIGISFTTSEFGELKSIAAQATAMGISVVAGGIHPTVRPEDVLAVPGVSMVVRGEGEQALVELLNTLEAGHGPEGVDNVWTKRGQHVIKNPVRPYIADLDSLPFMDYSIFDDAHHIGAYQGQAVRYIRPQSSRGCPFECSYCVNARLHQIYEGQKRHVRRKSPGRFLDELINGRQEINFEVVRMVDETFTAAPVEWLGEFARLYQEHIHKPIIITTRPESVSPKKMELLRTLHEDVQVTMGIETGNEAFRKKVCNRKMSNKTIIKAFHLCRELGFRTAAFNMLGLPGETRALSLETAMLNREARVDTPIMSYFYPFPGSHLRQVCLDMGYIEDELHDVDYSTNSFLNMPQYPLAQMRGIKRTFVLYAKMPKKYLPNIERAETDDASFARLAEIYRDTFA